jgi:death on curing protein
MADDHIYYLTPAEIHAVAETAIGHPMLARERQLILAAAARPALIHFGTEAYPTLMEKAAALLHSIAAHHPFWDGNKRAATLVTLYFLEKNGYTVTWSDAEVYDFMLEVAQNQHDISAIAAWLSSHTAPITD